jgi:hypothetical protein
MLNRTAVRVQQNDGRATRLEVVNPSEELTAPDRNQVLGSLRSIDFSRQGKTSDDRAKRRRAWVELDDFTICPGKQALLREGWHRRSRQK